VPVLAMQGPAFLPGSVDQEQTDAADGLFSTGPVSSERRSSETDLEEYSVVDAPSPREALLDAPSPRAALPGGLPPFKVTSLRGNALQFGRVASYPMAHPNLGQTARGLSSALLTLPDMFSLGGELIHVFVSYRVETEGPLGNRLSGRIAERIRALSMDSRQEGLQIPRNGNPPSRFSQPSTLSPKTLNPNILNPET